MPSCDLKRLDLISNDAEPWLALSLVSGADPFATGVGAFFVCDFDENGKCGRKGSNGAMVKRGVRITLAF